MGNYFLDIQYNVSNRKRPESGSDLRKENRIRVHPSRKKPDPDSTFEKIKPDPNPDVTREKNHGSGSLLIFNFEIFSNFISIMYFNFRGIINKDNIVIYL